MKKLIRKGVFETNSSSSHSISLAKEDKQFVLDTLYPDQHGVVRIHGGQYGWEWFKHNDAETKASYVAQSFANQSDKLELFAEVIKTQTGADDVQFIGLDDGYIDHDSYGVAPNSADDIRNFIFNKNSWLFGGNDNSTPAPEFYQVPEYRDGRMIYPDFKYELTIENFSKTSRFIDMPTDEELTDAIQSLFDGVLVTEDGDFIMDDSIIWKISRPRGVFYELGYHLIQDYSTNEILLEKEDADDFYDISRKMKERGMFEDIEWDVRNKMITEEIKKIPGAVLKIKFSIREIK
jgi:hypothetical protein